VSPLDKEKLTMKAEVFKAMGSPVRLGIIEFLEHGEKCVCEIVEHVGTDISNVSKHLALLKRTGVLKDRREGLKIYYSLAMPCAVDFARCIEGVLLNRLDRQRDVIAGEKIVACGC
jgi:DNA-binding transcriptional ArsR family regulator